MWWNRIVEWFSTKRERQECIRDFNYAAKNAFVSGLVPVYMKADISLGNSSYKHAMSNFFSGFRIKTLSGRPLTSQEVIAVGQTICSNDELMRRLISLGFDTVEIINPEGRMVRDWKLQAFIQIDYK